MKDHRALVIYIDDESFESIIGKAIGVMALALNRQNKTRMDVDIQRVTVEGFNLGHWKGHLEKINDERE